MAGSRDVMVAGGMESMTNAPYLLKKGRSGYRMGHDKVFDHMMLDGLEDAYEAGRSMGTFGEDCAAKYQFTREQQDAFAIASVTRAQQAIESGAFTAEIAPVTFSTRKGDVTVAKNYLHADEIDELNRIVVMWLDFAEDQAKRRKQVFLANWDTKLDEFLRFNERKVLPGKGNVSRAAANAQAEAEYAQFAARRRALLEAEGERQQHEALENAAKKLPRLKKDKQ